MTPRLRRLTMDEVQIRDELVGHACITVEPYGVSPPEVYVITYQIRGVMLDVSGQQPVVHERHVAHLYLGATYPRDKPMFLMQTPIFHPNFGARVGDAVCVGDEWTPAQPLVDLILKVGDMIQYREYNVKAPLNSDAARWVRHVESHGFFPIGNVPLWEPEVAIEVERPISGRSTHVGASVLAIDPDEVEGGQHG